MGMTSPNNPFFKLAQQRNENPQSVKMPTENKKSENPFYKLAETKNKTQFPVSPIENEAPDSNKGFVERSFENFGKGLSYQSQISNTVTPEGAAKLGKGLASGATIGLSENIPGFKTGDTPVEEMSKFFGSFAPIGAISKGVNYLNTPLFKVAKSSPILSKQLTSLLEIFGMGEAGATYKAAEDIFKGKMPTADDMLTHGTEWALLDTVLKSLGVSGQFISKLVNKDKGKTKSGYSALNEFITQNKEDFTTPERVAAKVLSFLEEQPNKKAIPNKFSESFALKNSENKFIQDSKKTEIPFAPTETSKDLSNTKFKRDSFDLVANKIEMNAQEYLPTKIKADDIEKKILDTGNEAALEEISPRAANDQELGMNVTNEIEKSIEDAEKKYQPKYEEVKTKAVNIQHTPRKTIQLAHDILEEITSLKTRPEGYQKVINNINSALSDMGYYVKDFEGNPAIFNSLGKKIDMKPLELFLEVPLSKSIELGKRLNKIIDFDIVGTSIKNRLKPVGKSLKKEVISILEKSDPNAARLLREADLDYAEAASKFGRDSIRKIRAEEAKEKITTLLKSPTAIKDLKSVVSPKQFSQIEREILENLKDMSLINAKNLLRNVSPHLSPKANTLARNIVEGKIPTPKLVPSQRQRLKSEFMTSLSKDIIQGQRPQNALDLWKTKQGQAFIMDSLKGNPNKENVLEYLKRQSFFDFAKSILTPEGKVDFKKFKQLLNDPATRYNLELVGGKDAVQFFDNLENFSNKLDKNLRIRENLPLDKIPTPKSERGKDLLRKASENLRQPSKESIVGKEKIKEKVSREKESTGKFGEALLKKKAYKEAPVFFKAKEFFEGLPDTVKIVGGLFGLFTYGPLKYLGAAKATQFLYKFATRPKLRSDMIKAMNLGRHNPLDGYGQLDIIGQALLESANQED